MHKNKIVNFIKGLGSINFLLIFNEFVSKFYSFFFFALMGVFLSKDEFANLVLEFPILFVFSSILTFSFSTYMFERLKETDFESLDFQSPSSLVLFINCGIAFISTIVYIIGIIPFHNLLIVFATITASLNIIQTESYFVLRRYKSMSLVNIAPKLSIIALAFIFAYLNKLSLNLIYILFIAFNLFFSLQVFKKVHFLIKRKFVLKYLNFSFVFFLQQFSAFLSYYIFRFFISESSDNNYLVEFGVLQTFLGIIYFHVGLSNRFLIFDILNFFKTKKYLLLKYKVDFSIMLLSLFSFIYFIVIVVYLTILNKTSIDISILIQSLIMLISAWFYYFTQFKLTILLYSGFRKKYIYINYLTLFVSTFLTLICSKLHYDILYPITLCISSMIIYLVATFSRGGDFYNKIFNLKSIFKSFSITICLIGIAAFLSFNLFYFLVLALTVILMYLLIFKKIYTRLSYLLIPKS